MVMRSYWSWQCGGIRDLVSSSVHIDAMQEDGPCTQAAIVDGVVRSVKQAAVPCTCEICGLVEASTRRTLVTTSMCVSTASPFFCGCLGRNCCFSPLRSGNYSRWSLAQRRR